MTQPGIKVGEGFVEVETRIDEQRTNRLLGRHFTRSGTTSARVFSRSFENGLNLGIPNRAVKNVDRDVDRHGRRWSSLVFKHLRGGFEGFLSLMPARLEAVFTKTGPIIGSILIGALLAAITVSAPFLGAALTGGIIAGLGLGAIAAGIALVADRPEIAKAANRLKERILGPLKKSADKAFTAPLSKALDSIGAAFERQMGNIDKIFKAAGKAIPGLTKGLVGFIEGVMPGLTHVFESPWFPKFMEVMSKGLTIIGQAFGDFFARFVDDPQAMKGALLGFEDLLNLVASSIRLTGDLLRALSRMYVWMDGTFFPAQRKGWKAVKDGLDDAFGAVKNTWIPTLVTAFGDTVNFFRRTWTSIASNTRQTWTSIAHFFRTTWTSIAASFRNTWTDIAHFFRTTFTSFMSVSRDSWTIFWGSLKKTAAASWNGIKILLNSRWIFQLFTSIAAICSEVWSKFWLGIAKITVASWNAIYRFLAPGLNLLAKIFLITLFLMQRGWMAVWNAIKIAGVVVWQAIARFFVASWNAFRNYFVGVFTGIAAFWTRVWKSISAVGVQIWKVISSNIVRAYNGIRNYLFSILAQIQSRFSAIFNSISIIIRSALTTATNTLRTMINGFIGLINRGVDAINAVLGKLGIKNKLPRINPIAAPFAGTISASDRRGSVRGNARGGYISGPGSKTSDSIPSWLSDGEYVVRASAVDAVGVPFLNAINGASSTPTGGPGSGFAGGGLYRQMQAWIQSRIPSTRISSSYRPGDPGYHGSGNAIDMVWPDGSERRGGGLAAQAFNLIKSTFFSGIKELIWDFAGSKAVWNGHEHFFTGPGAGPGTHNDHIHWAMGALSGKGGGSLLSGALGLLGMGWDHVLKKLVNPAVSKLWSGLPDSGVGAVFKGSAMFMGKQIVPWIKSGFDKAMEALGTLSGFTPGDLAGVGAKNLAGWISAAIHIAGVPASWAGPLRTLIMRESGGNPRAINLSDSNAARGTPSKGLAQVIGPTFATYRDRRLPNDPYNPIANLVAALRYIIARYGSIFNVQQANARMSPKGYDTGGIIPPGDTWVRNRTGSNEYLFNSDQMNTMSNTSCIHNVYVDGVKMLVREEIDSNNNHLVNAVSRGRRLP